MGYFDFSLPSFDGANSNIDMNGAGVLAPSSNNTPYAGPVDIPYVNEVPWYQTPSTAPAGVTDVKSNTNSAFWGFDQSKISASLQNVLGSVVDAGIKTGVQAAAGTINKQANGSGQFSNLFKNFRSTTTGAQINAGATAFSVQNFLANPMVWFGVVAVGILFFVLRKG